MSDKFQANNNGANYLAYNPLKIEQMYYPSDEELTEITRSIYNNNYYTNHGPLAVEFEKSLSSYVGTSHVVAATNATLGLMMSLVAFGVKGSVVVPSFSSPGVAEAVVWSGLTPVFCDVDEHTCHMTVDTISRALRGDTSTIIAVSLWGNVCEIDEIAAFANKTGLEIIHFAADSFGISINDEQVGSNGVTTIFSFDISKFISCSGGGCVATNDELFVSKIRNIRSSYGAGSFTKVPVTANGRFSEFQAAMGLWSLNKIEEHRSHNREIHEVYRQMLADVDDINIYEANGSVCSNYQDFVISVDSTRYRLMCDSLQGALEKKNIYTRSGYCRSLHNSDNFRIYHNNDKLPVTEALCEKMLQLPVGSQVTTDMANSIGALIKDVKA